MLRMLVLILLAGLTIASVLPEVMSYTKVTRNGQEETISENDQTSWTSSNRTENEGRSVKTISITVSPVYVPQRISKLQNGEAINYPPIGRYSTLDQDMLTKLKPKKQIQDRYHPQPFNTDKNKKPSDDVRLSPQPAARPNGPPSSSTFDISSPSFPGGYNYKPLDFLSGKPISKPPDYLSDKPLSKPPDDEADTPISKPLTMEDYANSEISDKPPDSYFASHDDESSDYSDFPSDSSYENDATPKPIQFSGHLNHPPYDNDDSYDHHHDFHHDFHDEVIYDHIPEHHDHTEQPEMNDQRLDKRPYSYYFIGKKLWYLPLYFSIYFIIYIAALVLKSIARHKIAFPAHLAEAVGHGRSHTATSWWDFAEKILEGIEDFAEKYGHAS